MARIASIIFAAALAIGAVSANPVARDYYTGSATWYEGGLGACGVVTTDDQYVVGVSEVFFNAWPGYDQQNPNNNPICGKKLYATYYGNTVEAYIADTNSGADTYALNFSPVAFKALANPDLGYIEGVQWHIE